MLFSSFEFLTLGLLYQFGSTNYYRLVLKGYCLLFNVLFYVQTVLVGTLFILAQQLIFVNIFFKLFKVFFEVFWTSFYVVFCRTVLYFIIIFLSCQQFFLTFLKTFFSLIFSDKMCCAKLVSLGTFSILTPFSYFVNTFFIFFQKTLILFLNSTFSVYWI